VWWRAATKLQCFHPRCKPRPLGVNAGKPEEVLPSKKSSRQTSVRTTEAARVQSSLEQAPSMTVEIVKTLFRGTAIVVLLSLE
jgi:hypothetical protein